MNDEQADLLAAARAGNETAFGRLTERYRRELRVHCYRMVGSFTDAEDLVQETFLRAWKYLPGFEGRSTVRVWLYRIATNVCLDVLERQDRRVLPVDLGAPAEWSDVGEPRTDIPWLQPFPDELVAPSEHEPQVAVIDRETIELAFLAAIQHLPPRQRAVLILRDVLGWSAKQTAELLESGVTSVNSALQRARATLREHLPERRLDWAPAAEPSEQERAVLRRYMDAMTRADLTAVANLLAEDVRTMMPPWPEWFVGRDAVVRSLRASWDVTSPDYIGEFRLLPLRANASPALAAYVRGRGETTYRAFAIGVLRIAGEQVVEVIAFHDLRLFAAFGMPAQLEAGQFGAGGDAELGVGLVEVMADDA